MTSKEILDTYDDQHKSVYRFEIVAVDQESASEAFNNATEAAIDTEGVIKCGSTGVRDPAVELYRCKECGRTDDDIGSLHAHIERHRGIFGIQLPWNVGDFNALNEMTEVLRAKDIEIADPEPESDGSVGGERDE